MKKIAFPLALALLAGGLIGLFLLGSKNKPTTNEQQAEKIGQDVPVMPDSSHVADGTKITYSTNPPTSGQHYAAPAEAGIKEGEIADEQAVHNLEHGYIWITYRPCGDQIKDNCLDENQIKELKRAAQDLPPDPVNNVQKYILSPRSRNERKITLVAWGALHHVDQVDAGQIRQFYDGRVNKGPEILP